MLQKVICILFTAAITTIISCDGLPAPVTCQLVMVFIMMFVLKVIVDFINKNRK